MVSAVAAFVLTPAVLDSAGVTLDDGMRVTGFATVRSGGIASSDDLWQLSLVDAGSRTLTLRRSTCAVWPTVSRRMGDVAGRPARLVRRPALPPTTQS